MNKVRLSVYLDPEMMAQLIELTRRKKQSKSLIAEAAIASFLTPDDSDRHEAALVRRLDLLTRQGERLERDLSIAVEALALFIKFWLTVTPPLPSATKYRKSLSSGFAAASIAALPGLAIGVGGRPTMA